MLMNFGFAIPLTIALALGSGFLANEWSHGALSESVGAGHHHALDFGGYHCAAHDDEEQGAMHMAHMHEAGASMPHDGCPGGPGMHDHGNGNMTMDVARDGMGDMGMMS